MIQEFNLKDLGQFLRRLYAKKWIILCPAVIGFAIATALAVAQRDIYRGETILIAEYSNQTGGSVRRSEIDRTKEILRSVRERVYADRFLKPMIEELGLHPDLMAAGNSDEAIAEARDELAVTVEGSKGVVKVTYDYDKGEDPAQKAADAANLASKHLVQTARGSIAGEATSLRDFHKEETERDAKEVQSLRNELRDFRLENAGLLPEDRAANEASIATEQRTIDIEDLKKDTLSMSITSFENELERAKRALYEARVKAGADDDLEPRRAELRALRVDLVRMERKYHPGAQKLKDMRTRIEDLSQEVEKLEKAGIKNAPDDDSDVLFQKGRVESIEGQLKRAREQREGSDDLVARARKRIEEAQNRLSESLRIEPQYTKLKEMLERAEAGWRASQSDLDSAERTLRFHNHQDEYVLHVNQSARKQPQPVGPNRLVMSLSGLILGLGLGAGIAFVRIRFDGSIRSKDELRRLLPSAVLVSIPDLMKPTRRVLGHTRGIIFAIALLLVFACSVSVLGFREGWWQAPEMAKSILERLSEHMPRM